MGLISRVSSRTYRNSSFRGSRKIKMLRTIRKPFSDAFQTVHFRRYLSVSYLKNHGGNQGGQASANKTDGLSLKRIAAMEKAQENKYFRELQVRQMQNLKLERKTEKKPEIEKSL